MPVAFQLYGNFPNPFNASTVIRYSLDKASDVSVKVYDLLGSEIAALQSGTQAAGNHEIIWRADRCASGVYFCRIQAGENSAVQKMSLLK